MTQEYISFLLDDFCRVNTLQEDVTQVAKLHPKTEAKTYGSGFCWKSCFDSLNYFLLLLLLLHPLLFFVLEKSMKKRVGISDADSFFFFFSENELTIYNIIYYLEKKKKKKKKFLEPFWIFIIEFFFLCFQVKLTKAGESLSLESRLL